MDTGKKKSFSTILVARSNDTRPSDLELQLRDHCHKMRILERLTGGAHLLFPEGEYSIAVRVYDENDIQELNKKYPPNYSDSSWKAQAHNYDDFENLKAFRAAFKRTVLLFIIPCHKQFALIDDTSSLFHRAQRMMSSSITQSEKVARVFLVPNVESAISAIKSMADALKKRDAKKVYYDRQRVKYFLPNANGYIPNSSAVKNAASQHVAEAFHEWADDFGLPPGEGGVLMSMLGSLENIVTADDNVLMQLPIEDRTRQTLHNFFGSKGGATNVEETTMPPETTSPLIVEDDRRRPTPIPNRIVIGPSPVPVVPPVTTRVANHNSQRGFWTGSNNRDSNNYNGLPVVQHRNPRAQNNMQIGRHQVNPGTATTSPWLPNNLHPWNSTMVQQPPIQPLYGDPPASNFSPFSDAPPPAPPTFHRHHHYPNQYARDEQQPNLSRHSRPNMGFRRFG